MEYKNIENELEKYIGSKTNIPTMNISYKELNNIEIPLPSIEEQKAIAEEYTRELEVYKKSIQEAENRWNSILAKLQDRI